MTITKFCISELFCVTPSRVKQIDSKQMFEIDYFNYSLLVSYKTVVGITSFVGAVPVTYLVDYKFSRTTSSHINRFKRDSNYFEFISYEELYSKLINEFKFSSLDFDGLTRV